MKKLTQIFLKINGFSFPVTFVLISIVHSYFSNDGTTMRNCYMPLFTEIVLSGLALLISFSTITIFFNLNNKINSDKKYITLSFFLLPLLSTFLILSVMFEGSKPNEFILYMSATLLPTWFFIFSEYFKFCKSIKG